MTLMRQLRDFVRGVTRVSYGSCGGDPIAWEKDLMLRRIRAREESSDPDTQRQATSGDVEQRQATSSSVKQLQERSVKRRVATVSARKP